MPRATLLRTLTRIAAAAALMAALLLAWRFPARWSGDANESSSTNAYVVLRPPTAAQVAHLLTMSLGGAAGPPGAPQMLAASVVAVEGDDVTVVTGQDAFGYTNGPDSARHGTAWASWNGYVLEHHVSKTALEAALGRDLRESDWSAAAGPHRVSYRSDHWLRYVAAEFVLLSALLWLGMLTVRVIRWPLLPLALLGYFALWFAVVNRFSPAFYDADFFHQRVVIEDVALIWWLSAYAMMPLAIVAPISALSIAAARGWRNRSDHPNVRRWAWVAGAAPPAVMLALPVGVWAWQGAGQIARAEEAASTTAASCLPRPRGPNPSQMCAPCAPSTARPSAQLWRSAWSRPAHRPPAALVGGSYRSWCCAGRRRMRRSPSSTRRRSPRAGQRQAVGCWHEHDRERFGAILAKAMKCAAVL